MRARSLRPPRPPRLEGRPGPGTETSPTRGAARERAILAAVIELLGEAGYEAMTMDAVAARAHASKTTIYRRWPGKPQLVRAAVDGYVAGRVLAAADTGTLRGDLLAVLHALRAHLTGEFLAMMSGLMHAMRGDRELAEALWSHLAAPPPAAEQIMARAAARGEVRPDACAELSARAHEVIEAHVLRRVLTGAELDEAFAVHVVDDLLLPVLRSGDEALASARADHPAT
jgi:AcrR family transcriptional regulator